LLQRSNALNARLDVFSGCFAADGGDNFDMDGRLPVPGICGQRTDVAGT
jgi:hypothetical protein